MGHPASNSAGDLAADPLLNWKWANMDFCPLSSAGLGCSLGCLDYVNCRNPIRAHPRVCSRPLERTCVPGKLLVLMFQLVCYARSSRFLISGDDARSRTLRTSLSVGRPLNKWLARDGTLVRWRTNCKDLPHVEPKGPLQGSLPYTSG